MSRPRPVPRIDVEQALTNVVAAHRIGGLLNAIDRVGKRAGGADRLPASVLIAANALWHVLDELDLTQGAATQAAEVWRDADV